MSFSSLKVSLCVLYIVIETVIQSLITPVAVVCYYTTFIRILLLTSCTYVSFESRIEDKPAPHEHIPLLQLANSDVAKHERDTSRVVACRPVRSIHMHPQQQQQPPSYNFLPRSLVRAVSNWREFIGGGFLYPVLCVMIGTSVLASI